MIDWPQWVLDGFLATVVLTLIEALARGFGFTRMNLPFILGTIFSGNRDRARLIGLGVHLLVGWIFALPYFFVFLSLNLPTWWFGALLGLGHGPFIMTALMPVMPAMHPRMADETHGPTPTRQLQPPGFLALNYGRRTFVVAILAHIVYGAILGGLASLQ